MENIKENIRESIRHMFVELEELRNEELIEDPHLIVVANFKPYRGMVISLVKTYSNLHQMCDYRDSKKDFEFLTYFNYMLESESKKLYETMNECKKYYSQFRCLNDAYIELTKCLWCNNKIFDNVKTKI